MNRPARVILKNKHNLNGYHFVTTDRDMLFLLSWDNQLGSIEEGKIADLVVLGGISEKQILLTAQKRWEKNMSREWWPILRMPCMMLDG